ncbi:MAG: RES domain-containing protein [Actinobacteria bacterium]|nr:RES domain-containing protein [Actinomycetota bacterium]
MKPRRLFRVFPWLENAKADEPGHPLHINAQQGSGRVDNPDHYLVLYASDVPVGAIGEAFGNMAIWSPGLLAGPPILPGSQRALATYEVGETEVLDLDDPHSLVERSLRPSRVVTRERAVTQHWAMSIHSDGRWGGVRWWSYHCPEWGSFGIWDRDRVEVSEVRPLVSEMGLVQEASLTLNRPWKGQ